MLNQYFSKVINVPHNADEEKYKTQKKNPEEIVLRIAKEKALSVLKIIPMKLLLLQTKFWYVKTKCLANQKVLKRQRKNYYF